jgi:pathogenesis-related protein 1
MLRITIITICLLFVHFANGQSPVEDTGSRIGRADAQKILEQHNAAREEVGVPGLEWSRELAAYAQEWADHLAKNGCRMEHRQQPMVRNEPVGENLYWGSSSEVYHPVDASLSWYSEKKQYKYGKFGKGNWQETGHYTQMVWRGTRQVGVGVAICKNGAILVVASYAPAGNYMDQLPY